MSFGIKRVLKKTAKIILILTGSAISLIALVFLLLAIPAVQTITGHKAAAYLSHKTGADISISQLHISISGKISLAGILILDQKKDTILYAGKIITGIHPSGLLNRNIHMRRTSLQHIRARISRSSKDSLYNFSFIINAFAGKEKNTDTSSAKTGFGFYPGNIGIHDLSCTYSDSLSGIFSNTSLNSFYLSPKKTDLNNLLFDLHTLALNGLNGSLLITKKSADSKSESNSDLHLLCERVQISNSAFTFADSAQKTVFRVLSGKFRLRNTTMDPGKTFFSAEKAEFSNGGFWYSFAGQKDTTQEKTAEKSGEGWMLKLASLDLENDQVHINNLKKPVSPRQFDQEHLNISALSILTGNSVFSNKEISVSLQSLTGKADEDFEIKEGSGIFKMRGSSISTEDLTIKTKNSSLKINSHFNLPADSIMTVEAELNARQLYTGDILYFAPQLRNQVFFSYAGNYSSVKANVATKGKKLFINNLDAGTASSTGIKLRGSIENFQEPSSALYDIKMLDILSSANDIEKMQLSRLIPSSIHLPDSIHFTSVFHGQVKNFYTESSLESSLGNADIIGQLDRDENFSGTLNLFRLNLPVLLGSAGLPGPVTLTATAKGHGLDTNSFRMDLQASIPSIVFNHYNWRNINLDEHISHRQYAGEVRMNDPNAEIILKGDISLQKGREEYKLTADVKGADLEKLKLSNNDYRIAFSASADLKGSSMYSVNGNAGITGIIISHNDKKYFLDSLLFAAVNEPGKSELNLRSPIVNMTYAGTFAPSDLAKEMKQYLNSYFKAFDMKGDTSLARQSFEFSIKVHNHPVLSEVIFPDLKIFEPGNITGKFDGANRKLEFNMDLPRLDYGELSVNKLQCSLVGDASAIKYKVSASDMSNSNLSFRNFQIAGNVSDQKILTNISSVDDEKNKKLLLNTIFTNEKEGKKFSIDPAEFVIMGKNWSIPADNFVLFRNKDFLIHKMDFSSGSGTIAVESVNNRMNDDISISIRNFNPVVFSDIIRKDSAWLEGTMNGEILLKRRDKNFGIIARTTIDSLKINQVSIGNVKLNGDDNGDSYNISLELSGAENEMNLKGNYSMQQNSYGLKLNSEIRRLSMRTVQAFFPHDVSGTEGSMKGNISVSGNLKAPVLNGNLNFENVHFNPQVTNSRLSIQNQDLKVNNNTLIFDSFTIKDTNDHEAVINGNISMKDNAPVFALNMHTQDFMILNTPRDVKKEFYGRLVADSRIVIKGDLNSPVVTSSIKVKKQSNFTFAVPEDRMSADRGEDVVMFEDSLKLNRILRRNNAENKNKSNIRHLNISSTIEIDKKATLRLLIDPISHDSLVMKGEGALSFALDPGGKMSLTGIYNISEGNYLASLENLIKRSFVIESGSSVIWNGDPLDAVININAHHIVRTSPIDLVAGQLSPAESAEFRSRQAFEISMNLRGPLLSPQISFEIHLAQGERGGNSELVSARLDQLNDDPSSLNKQVFSLLVLGRFTQENPLQTETNSTQNAARATVGKFLSSQLNQLSSKLIPGVDVNFDVQSYEDYSNGRNEGRTQVGVGISKQLFNERLSVQVGGAVDVEGSEAGRNNASDIAGDVTVEYKLSQDGTYRLKGFRNNQYAGLIEGQITETGAGIIYVKDFDRWKNLFRKKTQVFNDNGHAFSDK